MIKESQLRSKLIFYSDINIENISQPLSQEYWRGVRDMAKMLLQELFPLEEKK